jgi:hypothetical protein
MAKLIAWAATLFCVAVPARCAAAFAKTAPRLFFAISLYALSWALLLPYYSNTAQTELLPGFGGFALVLCGRLLYREADPDKDSVKPVDRLALWLLGFLAAPSAVSLRIEEGPGKQLITVGQTEAIVGTILTCLGYITLYSGTRELCRGINSKAHRLLLAVIVPYIGLEAWYIWRYIQNPPPPATDYWHTPPQGPMALILLSGFVVAKLLLTSAFLYLVLPKAFSEEMKSKSFTEKVMEFLGG